MKRSEKLFSKARREALKALTWFAGSICGVIWAVYLMQTGNKAGQLLLCCCFGGIWTAFDDAAKCARMMRYAIREAQYENDLSIRPRL